MKSMFGQALCSVFSDLYELLEAKPCVVQTSLDQLEEAPPQLEQPAPEEEIEDDIRLAQ